ncbi:MAG: HAD hydrolase-like protein [Bilophila wadsworthia]
MQYKTILFDLDGTLTDSEPGIVNSVRYALRSFGMEAEPATLRSFIGPPLYDSFRGTMGMSDADAKRAVDTYRVYFRDKGIFENAPYPGVPEMLEALRAAGRRLIVATSKPEVFAKRIAEHFGFAGALEGIYGAEMEGNVPQNRRDPLCHAGAGHNPVECGHGGRSEVRHHGCA